jgi:DNA-directed RNA polymerase specialized sigma24 family protein
VQSQQEAEDVVADCFEKVFAMPIKKRHQKFIEEEINIKALLLVMVKNKSLDVVKTKKTRSRIIDGIKKILPTEVFNGAKQTLTDENFKALLNCLPEKEKEIITLSIAGFSTTEIGKQWHEKKLRIYGKRLWINP